MFLRKDYIGFFHYCASDPAAPALRKVIRYTADLNYDALYDEFDVLSVSRGKIVHNLAMQEWLDVWISVRELNQKVLCAGMYVMCADGSQYFLQGEQIEEHKDGELWQIAWVYRRQVAESQQSIDLEPVEFAFFIDVETSTGLVKRLWKSKGGANYKFAEVFAHPCHVRQILHGVIERANPDSVRFA